MKKKTVSIPFSQHIEEPSVELTTGQINPETEGIWEGQWLSDIYVCQLFNIHLLTVLDASNT